MDPNDPKIVDVNLEPSKEILEDEVEKKVHIYVSHVPDFAEIIPILPLPAPSDKGTVDDNPVEVEGRVDDAGNDGNEDNEHSEDEDDFLPYISKLSNNEDKEIIKARKKMKSSHEATSRSKNARKGVKYGRAIHEIPSSSTGHNDLSSRIH
ncbi:hypothetical protein SLEP1_g49448 [Rubroshorea leprosula]|uniref:Uncharacterized protein n=1 Tax=Rubroshorea leprosula TaxID=152421 RepID=A0AAV5LXN0_9ROSI|nr:hypothetical protein SLEP1_g49448 [Rubroshorea leprosula]